MSGMRKLTLLIGYKSKGIFYPLEREAGRDNLDRPVMVPIPPCNQLSFIKELRSKGIKGKLKPCYRRLHSRRKTPTSVTQSNA